MSCTTKVNNFYLITVSNLLKFLKFDIMYKTGQICPESGVYKCSEHPLTLFLFQKVKLFLLVVVEVDMELRGF